MDQVFATAHVEQPVRQDRRRPERVAAFFRHQAGPQPWTHRLVRRDDRHLRHLVELLRVDLQEAQDAVLGQADEVTVDHQQRRPRQILHAPENLPRGELDAAQLGVAVVPAAGAVQVAVNVDGRHPVALH